MLHFVYGKILLIGPDGVHSKVCISVRTVEAGTSKRNGDLDGDLFELIVIQTVNKTSERTFMYILSLGKELLALTLPGLLSMRCRCERVYRYGLFKIHVPAETTIEKCNFIRHPIIIEVSRRSIHQSWSFVTVNIPCSDSGVFA